jgi:two-component system, sporulation sensor kinase E
LKKKLVSQVDETSKGMFQLIEENIKYSNKIIDDLLEYSKEIRLEFTRTTPHAIIKEALSAAKIPTNIHVLNAARNEPNIALDIQKMKRVFVNIIKNAVEAMPNGGTLTITSSQKDNNLQIAFSDTGTGMPKCILEKVWTPFFTTKAKGMGLGLPISKRIVEEHEGKISLESVIGKGTTFTISLPISSKIKTEGGEKTWISPSESLLSTTTKA